jgi:hypothetical protein
MRSLRSPQRAVLVNAGEPAVADNIRDQYRRKLAGLAHGASTEGGGFARRSGLSMAAQPRCTKEDVEAGSADPACQLAKPIHAVLSITQKNRKRAEARASGPVQRLCPTAASRSITSELLSLDKLTDEQLESLEIALRETILRSRARSSGARRARLIDDPLGIPANHAAIDGIDVSNHAHARRD